MDRESGKKKTAKTARAAAAPGRVQYAALCYRRKGKGVRVLLVTSRRRRRWVTPKGWPMKKLSPAATAAREAWEEAGVEGRVAQAPLGRYRYRKDLGGGRGVTCTVQLFPLEVERVSTRFPEARERTLRWMKPGKAARSVEEPELARLLRRFGARMKG